MTETVNIGIQYLLLGPMAQDKRYQAIALLMKEGLITRMADMHAYVPKTTMRKDLNISYTGWDKRMKDPGKFQVEEMALLAELIGCDYLDVARLIFKEYTTSRK